MIWLIGLALAGIPESYQASYDAEARGDVGGALVFLEALPTAEKARYVFLLRRAWLLYTSGRYPDAAVAYDAAIAAEPRAVEPKLGKLLPLLAARRFQEADRLATTLLKADPENTVARSRRAWARYNLGRYADAEADYRAVLEAFPSDVEMMAGAAWCRKQLGDEEGARRGFERVLEISPRHPTAALGLR